MESAVPRGDFVRLPEAELLALSVNELRALVRRHEQERLGAIADQANLMKDINKRMQIHLLEIRGLKEVNQRLQDDVQELRDLCCFLDDDRQKSRKLAREWQRFGRYTSSVMKSEVSAYQEKLNELESKQNDLLQENIELKELCLYLDEERGAKSPIGRDHGDGSSIASLSNEGVENVAREPTFAARTRSSPESSTINEHTSQYINHLENHVRTLEDQLAQMDVRIPTRTWSSPFSDEKAASVSSNDGSKSRTRSPAKPEAVVHAMRPTVDVHDQLNRVWDGSDDDGLNEMERAVLKQMCQVTKRRIDQGPSPQATSSYDSVNENYKDDNKVDYSGPQIVVESGKSQIPYPVTNSDWVATQTSVICSLRRPVCRNISESAAYMAPVDAEQYPVESWRSYDDRPPRPPPPPLPLDVAYGAAPTQAVNSDDAGGGGGGGGRMYEQSNARTETNNKYMLYQRPSAYPRWYPNQVGGRT